MPLLELNNLGIEFRNGGEATRVVSGLSFSVESGETLAIVGESGCGKSVTSMSILRLLPTPQARISGEIMFDGRNLLALSEDEMQQVRGDRIGMIFQEPMTSLNPVLTVGRQIRETIRLHQDLSRGQTQEKAVEMLELVGIPEPRRRMRDYPFQLSGGMRQRVMIAMALSCEPALLIADEPTTALDVTIQAQILELVSALKARTNAAVLLITHDLGVVAENADRVVVMYAGRKVEEAPVNQLFATPKHPYTRGLLNAVPRLGQTLGNGELKPLEEIPGTVPPMSALIQGCAFASRCPIAIAECTKLPPTIQDHGNGHLIACHRSEEIRAQ